MRSPDRLLVFYLFSFLIISISIALAVTSIASPHWLNAKFYPEDEKGEPVRIAYGLHEKCSSVTESCTPFPELECVNGDREFCNIWRTTSFMMWLSLVILGPTVISYITLIFSSRQKRETGWRMISLLLFFVVAVQIIAMAAVAHLLQTDPNLKRGNWKLGVSWGAATASWIVTFFLLLLTIVVGLRTVPHYALLPASASRQNSVDTPMRRVGAH
ncbi:hypothetical protein POJ06DRAFT_7569 [Lipomyces tetrasporus]|uniref:Uncharacterized protein n=1 Tax=Lipomyces tetrasporus TaxID=54092 RepID=A0AAD7VW75_9ASCO|nr:uncharacterized protein POJ06DRAFT_7569 [Lipomyces tetrasporus]KAJ8103811.1 hypothetical protein POJ06DRAFT_7569 [Lipomyces tetrasporus]